MIVEAAKRTETREAKPSGGLSAGPSILWANLDAEAAWAGITLPRLVRERIATLGVLAAALVDADAEVWTIEPVDPARLVGPLRPALRHGRPPRWDLAWAEPSAKAANDRRFALPFGAIGARVATTLSDFDDLVGPWVAKAPWTAAGRDRVRGDGPPPTEHRTRARRLLETFGALVIEPWCERLVDVGVCVSAADEIHAPHGLLVDARGGFLGIELAPPAITDAERGELLATVARVCDALRAIGYRGPFSVDAFVYRDASGVRRLQPCCEINARHTFGHVAHALARRYGATALGFGAPPPDATVLVDGAAWMR